MPRGFSETERAMIRAKLLAAGRDSLATYGVRKTSVDDLVQAVGISKGAFYAFFDTKEELFLTLFRQFEEEYRADLLRDSPGDPTQHAAWLRTFFQRAATHWRTNPLFRHFGEAEYTYLTRKFPAEAAQAMLDSDRAFVADLLAHWDRAGLPLDCDADTFTGLMRGLFFMTLNAKSVGSAFPNVLTIIIDGIVLRLLPQHSS